MLIPPDGVREAGRSRPSATTSPGSSPAPDGRLYAINPEAGYLRRRARHHRRDRTRTRWRRSRANTIFTNVALTDDGDVWWEGMTDEPPAHADRLAGQRLDARLRAARRRIRTPASPRRSASARRSTPTGTTRRACRSRRSSSAAAARARCRWCTRRSTGRYGVYLAATMGSETTAAAAGAVGRGAPRPVRDAAVLRLQHGRLLQPLAATSAGSCRTRRASSTSTGSARTTTASSSGPASARTCAC